MPGNFRLYYQNDFFGSDTSQMQYRLQHFYGQYYGIVGGFTYGVFEDPDAWPDTVDYEGPNAVIFARRPLLHYTLELPADWSLTLGLEEPKPPSTRPAIATPTSQATRARRRLQRPLGRRATSATCSSARIFRSLGVAATTSSTTGRLRVGSQPVRLVQHHPNNDLPVPRRVRRGRRRASATTRASTTRDAAFDGDGDLVALEYVSGMGAFTHNWTPRWRSTATFGYVNVENTSMQAADAYDCTHYGSVNVIYQIFKRAHASASKASTGSARSEDGDDTATSSAVNLGFVYAPFD